MSRLLRALTPLIALSLTLAGCGGQAATAPNAAVVNSEQVPTAHYQLLVSSAQRAAFQSTGRPELSNAARAARSCGRFRRRRWSWPCETLRYTLLDRKLRAADERWDEHLAGALRAASVQAFVGPCASDHRYPRCVDER